MSFFRPGTEWHAAGSEFAAGECVTYVRGTDEISGVIAVRGQSQFDEFPSDMDARVQSRSLDWLIRPESLELDGSRIEPRRGDLITTASGDKYEVMPGPDETAWLYSGQFQTFFRIHTVKR